MNSTFHRFSPSWNDFLSETSKVRKFINLKIRDERHSSTSFRLGLKKNAEKFFQAREFSEQLSSFTRTGSGVSSTRERVRNGKESCIKIPLKHDVLHLTARMKMMFLRPTFYICFKTVFDRHVLRLLIAFKIILLWRSDCLQSYRRLLSIKSLHESVRNFPCTSIGVSHRRELKRLKTKLAGGKESCLC